MSEQSTLLSAENSLLLLIDIQTKLTQVMPESAAEDMQENSHRLIESANLLDIPVVVTEQYPKGLGATLETLKATLNNKAICFEKTSFSCCAANDFQVALQKSARTQIIIAGQETHVCILQTALQLLTLGYQVHILEDAVCSRKAEHKFYALQRMQQQGAIISNFESVLFEWLQDSKHPHFSRISQLLR